MRLLQLTSSSCVIFCEKRLTMLSPLDRGVLKCCVVENRVTALHSSRRRSCRLSLHAQAIGLEVCMCAFHTSFPTHYRTESHVAVPFSGSVATAKRTRMHMAC